MLGFLGKRKAARNREYQRKFRWKYENLRYLLRQNSDLLEILADIQSYVGGRIPRNPFTHNQISDLLDGTLMAAGNLNNITDGKYSELFGVHRKIAGKIQKELWKVRVEKTPSILMPLESVNRGTVGEAGGKAGHLGELHNIIPENVSKGFILTTFAYQTFMNENNLTGQIRALYSKIYPDDFRGADFVCSEIRKYVDNGIIPEQITGAIEEFVQSFDSENKLMWAVRSSAVGEDGLFSFAGQFDSILNVPAAGLNAAYLKVIASKFNTNAVLYRLMNNIRDAESAMAVLFIPMINAEASGVIFTRDPSRPENNEMMISSVNGLAADLVAGQSEADTFYINRETLDISDRTSGRKETVIVPSEGGGLIRQDIPAEYRDQISISDKTAKELAEIALKIEKYFGKSQDIEWVLDKKGKCWIIQSRPIRIDENTILQSEEETGSRVLIEGGATIFPGKAQGKLQLLESIDKLDEIENGAIMLVNNAEPEITSVFPRISGVITETGHPTSHAANVAREFGLPSLFNLENALKILKGIGEIGLDSRRRRIYEGLPWPNLPSREHIALSRQSKTPQVLRDLLFRLNLTDPIAANFTPGGCRSIHDIIRYVHHMAVTSLFDLGDAQVENLKESFKLLDTNLPLFLTVLDIGDTIDKKFDRLKKVPPEGISSEPFKALWKGISNSEIRWTGRTSVSISGVAAVVMSSMSENVDAIRRIGDRNYIIVGPEYLNFNARLAYHFTMIDAMVSDRPHNNYIIFRFRGGGAGRARRDLRARFLTGVLRYLGFSVDQREDLVTAWYKGYRKEACNEKLDILGKLMGCARQLDMLTDNVKKVNYYIKHFIEGDYKPFY